MRFDVILLRVIFAVALVAAGAWLQPVQNKPWTSAGVGALVAVAIILFELRIRQATLKTLIGAAVGSILGIIGAFLIGELIMRQESLKHEVRTFVTLGLVFFMAYVGLMVGAAKGDYLELSALGGIFSDKAARRDLKILDTSVIIDGRIADVAETGFLTGTLVVPQFILRELQQVADSADSSKRQRGRRGLDMLNRLQNNSSLDIQISEADFPSVREVDLKLIELGKQIEAGIVPNDFYLNKITQLRGGYVLHIYELSTAVQSV